jgi:hypothetical protein
MGGKLVVLPLYLANLPPYPPLSIWGLGSNEQLGKQWDSTNNVVFTQGHKPSRNQPFGVILHLK